MTRQGLELFRTGGPSRLCCAAPEENQQFVCTPGAVPGAHFDSSTGLVFLHMLPAACIVQPPATRKPSAAWPPSEAAAPYGEHPGTGRDLSHHDHVFMLIVPTLQHKPCSLCIALVLRACVAGHLTPQPQMATANGNRNWASAQWGRAGSGGRAHAHRSCRCPMTAGA